MVLKNTGKSGSLSMKNSGSCVIYATHSSLRCVNLKNDPVSSIVFPSFKKKVWALYLHISGVGKKEQWACMQNVLRTLILRIMK